MLKLTEVAERLNCSLANVYGLKDAGLLSVVSTGASGKGFRVTSEELERFIAERRGSRRKDSPAFPKKSSPQPFKHLDGTRLLAAWKKRGSPDDRQDADSARSSPSSRGPSKSQAS